ncbi:CvpA family protein [Flavobacterium orientale]|uniref:Colicin V production protein n=1 Tax=Flavobacterium orientale TaxID=1756020 RepID=A0A916XWK0_9FLAO|nr:CvpA family protein [Flavobacterium orientale]GGD17273.1 colicin V production protein [Flavobacterium orientale]
MDIAIGILLIIGLYQGIKNGLFVEVASIISFILGVFIAIKFSYLVKGFLEGYVSWNPQTIQITSFVITLILVVIGVHLLAKIFTQIASFAFLGWINKLAGGVFSVIKTALLLGIVLNLVQKINVDNQLISVEKQDNSIFYRPILDTTAFMMPMVSQWIEDVKELYEETTSTP